MGARHGCWGWCADIIILHSKRWCDFVSEKSILKIVTKEVEKNGQWHNHKGKFLGHEV